jgi:hypothetical protein
MRRADLARKLYFRLNLSSVGNSAQVRKHNIHVSNDTLAKYGNFGHRRPPLLLTKFFGAIKCERDGLRRRGHFEGGELRAGQLE